MKQGRPSVYNLPQNPINNKGFQYSYMQSRMEAKRREIVSSQTQNAFQLNKPSEQQKMIPLENAAYANSLSNMPLQAYDSTASQLAHTNLMANGRASSAGTFKNPVSNSYLRN